jgi:hypothetical protein
VQRATVEGDAFAQPDQAVPGPVTAGLGAAGAVVADLDAW